MIFNNAIEELLSDPVQLRVYKVLDSSQTGFTGRAIGRLVGTSTFKINQVLRRLVQWGIVYQTVLGRAHLYRFNPQHIFVQKMVPIIINFQALFFSEIGKMIDKHLKVKPLSVILYGSVARQEEQWDSDIDILIVYKNKTPQQIIEKDFGDISGFVTLKTGNHASIKAARVDELQKSPEHTRIFMKNVVRDGLVISGLSMTELLQYDDKKTKNR